MVRGCKARKQVHEMRVLAPLLHLCLHKKAALVRTRYRPVSLAIITLNSAVCRHVGLGQSKVTEGRGSNTSCWHCLVVPCMLAPALARPHAILPKHGGVGILRLSLPTQVYSLHQVLSWCALLWQASYCTPQPSGIGNSYRDKLGSGLCNKPCTDSFSAHH